MLIMHREKANQPIGFSGGKQYGKVTTDFKNRSLQILRSARYIE